MEDDEDIELTLRKKRKVREYKSCYPCRRRKVKCNNEIPCRNCRARDHEHLCTYERPEGRDRRYHAESQLPIVTTSRSNSTSGQYEANDIFRVYNQADPEPLQVSDPLTGETIFLGANSAPAVFVRYLQQAISLTSSTRSLVQALTNEDVTAVFGLDNSSVTYPFLNLWSTGDGSNDGVGSLRDALPSDLEILKAFHQYRSFSYIYYPAILDLGKFEIELYSFLSQRESESGVAPLEATTLHGKPFAWIGILYALLAAAAQFNDASIKERSWASRVFVCLSFQCLRMTNFFQRPSIKSVQTMLLIGSVLQNDRNPGVAWTLMGMTIRSAESMGLHSVSAGSDPTEIRFRQRLWYAIVWQDTILSLSHDRSTSTICSYAETPNLHTPEVLGFSTGVPNVVPPVPSNTAYEDSIRRLCPIIHAILKMRCSVPTSTAQYCTIESLYSAIERLRKDAKPDLQNRMLCTTRAQHMEYLALTFSLAYAKSELCRPVIELRASTMEYRESQRAQSIHRLFVQSAQDAIHAFLDLREFDRKLVRTWAAMHRVLSTSLVLGLVSPEEGWMGSDEIRQRMDALRRLIPVLEELIVENESAENEVVSNSEQGEECGPIKEKANPLRKATQILRALIRG